MCGIIGYTGRGEAVEKLITGLISLEYRGYDSSGIAYFEKDGSLCTRKSSGRLDSLTAKMGGELPVSRCGIGHTRWATHGEPSDVNAHPHGTERLTLVHNGIIENYAPLREELLSLGYTFDSGTDTEVAAKLMDYYYRKLGEPLAAIAETSKRLQGSYAFGILFAGRPGEIYAVRCGSPLIVAQSEDGNFIASDIPAFLRYTGRYFRLEEGEVACLGPEKVQVLNSDGEPIEKTLQTADFSPQAAERGGYAHFMLKEIGEEPRVIADTVRSIRKKSMTELFPERLLRAGRPGTVHIIACGTAMHAGLVGQQFIEKWARLPVRVSLASEFRYGDPILGEDDLALIISQSGETADTLAALRLAKERGVFTLAVVNVVGSSIAREADRVLHTLAGPEIAVASTKAYSSQLAVMYPLALRLAELCGRMTQEQVERLLDTLEREVPAAVSEMIARGEEIRALALRYHAAEDLFFLGRGLDWALSQEASLKLKEISYIHCEAYAAGELKHGTISLVTEGVPVLGIATVPELYGKMISNIKEVRARGADVVMLVGHGTEVPADVAVRTVRLPEHDSVFSPFSAITALQLFAYYMAVERGCDVDRPRNLAKSVTVE